MMGHYQCNECAATAVMGTFLQTGRVEINGMDAGQTAYFCAEHAPPKDATGEAYQPQNAKRVHFRYPRPVSQG